MKNAKPIAFILAVLLPIGASAQDYQLTSPDGHLGLTVSNGEILQYSLSLDGRTLVAPSPMGFQLRGEKDMTGHFQVLNDAKAVDGVESWTPVVRNKHAECRVPYREITLQLKEKADGFRRMDVTFRVMDDGVAFRYTLFGVPELGNRQITRELTGFNIPATSSLWIPNFAYEQKGRSYKSSQEGEFVETPVAEIDANIHAGLPGLIRVDDNNWMAILEADLNNFPAFYLGRNTEARDGYQLLSAKLTPIWGEPEDGVKARFSESCTSSWRVVMAGHNPGKFIESEILRSLNPDCAIHDTSWIKPGMSAWDHWWSGEVKMEQPVIKQYIDFAAKEGWPYMLIDWTWYGPYCTPSADITQPAPQLDMPEIIRYAAERNVGIWLWLRCEDANHNDQYKEAFPLYHKWGVKGVKIDFMDRDDQDMVCWYRRIIQAAADNELMLDFHGAYKPDGIERTYPHLLTREGVMGSEYYKFSDRVTPEHNVTLTYTRLLAGQMDYTPGGFLNVTQSQFRQQSPTLVSNTRAAELAKFVVYESPFMCFCDHPDNVYGQVGEDFVSQVPTTWDDIRFLGGDPSSYVAIAKRSGDCWYVGVLNNSQGRTVRLSLPFLEQKSYTVEYWKDGKKADKVATSCEHKTISVQADQGLNVRLAPAGGYVAIIKEK